MKTTNQTTDKATVQCKRCNVILYRPYVDGKFLPVTKTLCPACEEHAALVAVAELMKNNAENRGCENFIKDGSYCDCFICKSREALAQLAAVQGK